MSKDQEHLRTARRILDSISRANKGAENAKSKMEALMRVVDDYVTLEWASWAAALALTSDVAQLRAERDEARAVAEKMRTEYAQNYGGEYALPWDIDCEEDVFEDDK